MEGKNFNIALDVGGTYIKSVLLDTDGNILPHSSKMFPAKSKAGREEIIDNFIHIIEEKIAWINDEGVKLQAIGMAFPGPFDYENGISYIEGVDKFECLYGVNLRTELLRRIAEHPFLIERIVEDPLLIVFENDANLFALGEYTYGKGKTFNRSIYFTLGTGIGSAFIENGELVQKDARVPENGWIYNDPFGTSIVDDYISKRGILKLAQMKGYMENDSDVKSFADLARKGNQEAKEVFHQFGLNIGTAIHRYVESFQPEAIIFGGQISKSMDLFEDGILENLAPFQEDFSLKCSENTSKSTFQGIGTLIDRKRRIKSKG